MMFDQSLADAYKEIAAIRDAMSERETTLTERLRKKALNEIRLTRQVERQQQELAQAHARIQALELQLNVEDSETHDR